MRIAVTALCLTACVLLVALWVRSYWRADVVYGTFSSEKVFSISTTAGGVAVHLYCLGSEFKWNRRG
jgi:hypothetical protein